MRFNLVIIGDEILNGRRQDRHLANTIELFADRGLELSRSLVIGDDPQLITDTLRYLNKADNIVFTFGGIGATPDDYTRQCAAEAFNVSLEIHEQGKEILQEKFADRLYPHRINMVNIPRGSRLIPNPVNNVPGFSYQGFHFVPGFPQMAMPMVAWVLDHEYAHLQPSEKALRRTVVVYGRGEGDLVDLMNALVRQYPTVKLSCLPKIDPVKSSVELSVLGSLNEAELAYQFIVDALNKMNLEWQ